MIVGLSKMYQEKNITVAQGDWQQIRVLMAEYRSLILAKWLFVERIGVETLGTSQVTEAQVMLVKLTGRIKYVDGLIHFLMFGGEIEPEAEPLTFKQLYTEVKQVVINLSNEQQTAYELQLYELKIKYDRALHQLANNRWETKQLRKQLNKTE